MKKTVLLNFVVCLATPGFSQGGWIKVAGTNPVTSFTSNGIYKGAAWVDINNDGLIDLFASPNFLFQNNGSGTFSQLGNTNINPNPLQFPGGCSWGDINNDGYIDFITAQNPSEIYLNNGNGSFQNISGNISQLNGFASWGCVLADVNNDNTLDLLYAQAHGFHGTATPYPCKFFVQDPSTFQFVQKNGYTFSDSLKPYTVPYFHDYDMDGDMDLFIATGPGGSPGPDYCYKNMKEETGKDTLYRMINEPWASQLQDGQCYNAIDSDNDGDLDLCLTNYGGAASRFYQNDGGIYTSINTPFTNPGNRLSNCWGDYDNDGDLDLFMASDSNPLRYYRNDGNNSFILENNSLTVYGGSSSVVNCDYDNDGDLDVFVYGQGNARSLWQNDTLSGSRKWINITLKGLVSNRSAIGAIVKLKSKIKGNDLWQVRHLTAQNSFQGQNDLRLHFGLSTATIVDTILIYWPSGIKEIYTQVNTNQFLTYAEGKGEQVGMKELKNAESQLEIFPNPATDQLTVILSGSKDQAIIKIHNSSGFLLYSTQVKSRKSEISIRNYNPGVYFVVVEIGSKTILKKIIIQ